MPSSTFVHSCSHIALAAETLNSRNVQRTLSQRRHLTGASSLRRSGYTTAAEPHAWQANSVASSNDFMAYDPLSRPFHQRSLSNLVPKLTFPGTEKGKRMGLLHVLTAIGDAFLCSLRGG
jgi:hypothetical protein